MHCVQARLAHSLFFALSRLHVRVVRGLQVVNELSVNLRLRHVRYDTVGRIGKTFGVGGR